MSGIAGIIDIAAPGANPLEVARRMATAMARFTGAAGDSGWSDDAAGIGLVGETFSSADGRWVAVLDGIIYNRADLRRRLDSAIWRGPSDCETLVEAVARWGVERTLPALDGSFAMALWDRRERVLHLARDPMGERPLYWSARGDTVLFGSDLAALRVVPGFDASIDPQAAATFLRFGHIPAPMTIHRGGRKLPAGTILSARSGGPSLRSYWSVTERAAELAGSFAGGPTAAAERLNLLLRASVALRLDVDRKVGVILTGDCPSALAAAVAHALGAPPLTSVSLEVDGADPAAGLAQALGTCHQVVRPSDDDIRAAIGELPRLWSEPFADPAMPMALLTMRKAAQHMDAALVGIGAPTLFGGDPLYRLVTEEWQRVRSTPPWLAMLDRLMGCNGPAPSSPSQLLGLHRSLWRGLPSPLPGANDPFATLPIDPAAPTLGLMAADAAITLSNRRLVLAERAAAAEGLELRAPFLDTAMVEMAWSLPVCAATSFPCLREVLCRYLPASAAATAAPAAAPPLRRWLDGPLAEWAGDLLSETRLKRYGLIDSGVVARLRRQHSKGRDRSGEMWSLLMLQAWLESV